MTDSTSDSPNDFTTHFQTRMVTQPLLIALLVMTQLIGLTTIMQYIAPSQNWTAVALLCFAVSLETIYTTFWLNHRDRLILNRTAYRLAEGVLFIFATRLLMWLTTREPIAMDWLEMLRHPLTFLLADFFPWGLVIVLWAWQKAADLALVFDHLAIQPREAAYYALPRAQRNETIGQRPFEVDRSFLLSRYFQQWGGGGIFLMVCAAITTFDFRKVNSDLKLFSLQRLGLDPHILLALLVYFLGGFLLLGYGRLAVMNARWMKEGVKRETAVATTWQTATSQLILAVALLMAFVPIGSSFTISRILMAIVFAGILFVNLLLTGYSMALVFILTLLAQLFPGQINPPLPTSPPSIATPPPPPPQAPPNETLTLITGSFFWLALGGVLIIALLFFWQGRGISWRELFGGLFWQRGWVALWAAWRRLRQQVAATGQALRARLGLPDAPLTPPNWRLLRLRSLSPQERVRFFYLTAVRRASESGVKREANETPNEYIEDLTENWPTAETELNELTQAFLKARYSPTPISETDAQTTKTIWQRIRQLLKKKPNSPTV